jgi:hypothetical protein
MLVGDADEPREPASYEDIMQMSERERERQRWHGSIQAELDALTEKGCFSWLVTLHVTFAPLASASSSSSRGTQMDL